MVATGFLVTSSLSAFAKEVRNCVSLSVQHSDREQQHNSCSETLEAESAESDGDNNNAAHHDAPPASTNNQSLWQHSSRAFLESNSSERSSSARHNSAAQPSSTGAALAVKRSINEIAQATLRDFSATLDESEKSKYLLKFVYLFMYNMDLSAAYFPTSKIMASHSFSVKRKAYLFAETCWTNKDEISFLCTNIFCSDIKRKNILRVLPINILVNTMTENSAHIILDTVLTNSICADTECRLKMLTLLSSIYITIGAIPNDHLSRLAGSISIQSPNEILMVFISFVIKICSNMPNVSIDFKPALFKILQVKINEPIISYNLLKLLGKLSETDETLKIKLYRFFEKIVTINLRPSLFFRIVDILCIDESQILTDDSKTLRTAIFQLFRKTLTASDHNICYMGLIYLEKYLRKFTWSSFFDSFNEILINLISSEVKQISIYAIKLVSLHVESSNLIQIVKIYLRILSKTNDLELQSTLFDCIIKICQSKQYKFLEDSQNLLEWYIMILVELSGLMSLNSTSLQLIISELQNLITQFPSESENIISQVKAIISACNLKDYSRLKNIEKGRSKFYIEAFNFLIPHVHNIKDLRELLESLVDVNLKKAIIYDHKDILKTFILIAIPHLDDNYQESDEGKKFIERVKNIFEINALKSSSNHSNMSMRIDFDIIKNDLEMISQIFSSSIECPMSVEELANIHNMMKELSIDSNAIEKNKLSNTIDKLKNTTATRTSHKPKLVPFYMSKDEYVSVGQAANPNRDNNGQNVNKFDLNRLEQFI